MVKIAYNIIPIPLKLASITRKHGIAFFMSGYIWVPAEKSGIVMGYIIYKGDLEIEKLS